ncbi:TPA: hypothetical protein ACG3ZG_003966 [Yersinia enterocolitica]
MKTNNTNAVPFSEFIDPLVNAMLGVNSIVKENNDNAAKRMDISIDCYRKLNRAANVSLFLSGDLIKREINGLHQLYVPDILSYIGEDVQAALSELKENGVFDVFIQQEQLSKP